MIQFFTQIGNIINAVIGFVVHGIQMIVAVLTTMVQAVAFIIAAIANLPVFVIAPVTVSISIAVILFLINKGSAG